MSLERNNNNEIILAYGKKRKKTLIKLSICFVFIKNYFYFCEKYFEHILN